MWADTEPELRDFAATLGMPVTWLRDSGTADAHYMVSAFRRSEAIAAGAKVVRRSDWLREREHREGKSVQ